MSAQSQSVLAPAHWKKLHGIDAETILAHMLGHVRCIEMNMTTTINVQSVEPRGIIVKVELQNLDGYFITLALLRPLRLYIEIQFFKQIGRRIWIFL